MGILLRQTWRLRVADTAGAVARLGSGCRSVQRDLVVSSEGENGDRREIAQARESCGRDVLLVRTRADRPPWSRALSNGSSFSPLHSRLHAATIPAMRGSPELDQEVRRRAFQFLDDLRAAHGNALPREILAKGFVLDGARVPLMGPQGIFKPAVLRAIPLSITTVPVDSRKPRPYEDEMTADGTIHYKYRGMDPSHPDNAGLREAMRRQAPLIYFVGLVPGRYYAEY